MPVAMPTVEGKDLPLNMPCEALDDLEGAAARRRVPSMFEKYSVPLILSGRDLALIGVAPTGTEQVAPLVLPLVTQLIRTAPASGGSAAASKSKGASKPRAVVLAPTRALASFATNLARELAEGTSLKCARACGGTTIDASVAECAGGVDLLVATPGRLLDLLDRGACTLDAVKSLVLVGADALFDGGFEDHMRRVVVEESMPGMHERQTTLSCASLTPPVLRVASHLLRASFVRLTAPKPYLAASVAPLARQYVKFVDERSKQSALTALLAAAAQQGGGGGGGCGRSIVAVGLRRHCDMVLYFLQGEGYAAVGLSHEHPKRSEKEALLASLASGAATVLVATDAALRALGEDLCPVSQVISFDFPPTMEEYASRLSHTARHGHTGRCTTFVSDATPREHVESLVELLQFSGNEVPRWLEGLATISAAAIS